MTLICLSTLTTRSNADTTCGDVIKSCDKALSDRDKLESAQKTAFDDAVKALTESQGKIDEDEAKLSKWWRNPFILVPTTALLTFLAHETVEHSLFR